MKRKEEHLGAIIRRARTIRHLIRALNTTEDESKWKDLAKVVSIDADELAELVLQQIEFGKHGK